MRIVDLKTLTDAQLRQAAQVLTDGLPLGWPSLSDAQRELTELHLPENHLAAALEGDVVVGWAGLLPAYEGRVRELHPLVVREDRRRQGIGAALLAHLEDWARKQGAHTFYIAADDDKPGGETSLANVDLYFDLPARLASFHPGAHQTAFYLKQGYTVVGVLPDANGPGKPDIYLAKRL